MATPSLNLPYIAEGQGQPHVTHNEALLMLDGLHPRVAISATDLTPPAIPLEGGVYIMPIGASGFHAAAVPGDVCLFSGGIWHRLTPKAGWRFSVLDRGGALIYNGSEWVVGDVIGAMGSTLGLRSIEVEVGLSGGASIPVAALIPSRAIILGVTSWTIEDVTGATSYSVGIAGEVGKFGGSLGAASGSSNVGVVGPFATYSPTDVIVTAEGGPFTGGKVGLAVSAILPGAPA